jgi:hypothetical protein
MSHEYPKSLTMFLEACIAETRELTATDSAVRDITLSLAETIYSEEGALPPTRNVSPRQEFFRSLFFYFNELFVAYQTLVEFPVFARSRPPKLLKFSKARLVTFWREAYLNEYYIYLQRLNALLTRVSRWYRKDTRLPRLPEAIQGLRDAVHEQFVDLERMRGSHVHEHRYQHSDPELQRLHLLELLAVESKLAGMRPLYVRAVQKAKARNTQYFRRITKRAKDGLKLVFDCFAPAFIDPNGRIIYPANLKRN